MTRETIVSSRSLARVLIFSWSPRETSSETLFLLMLFVIVSENKIGMKSIDSDQ